MITVGGNSYSNGIRFVADKYSVSFITKNNVTKISLRKNENEKETKAMGIVGKLPLMRGIISLIRNNKLLLVIIILDIVQNSFLLNSPIEGDNKINTFTTMASLFVLIASLYYLFIKLLKNIKFTRRYHGAEHKIIFTYYSKEEMSLDNCKDAPRANDKCGTMLVVLIVFIEVILRLVTSVFAINMWLSVRFLIVWTVAYELFLLDRKTPVLCMLFKVGYWLQEHLFTSEPSDFELLQAIEAFELLEQAETGGISEEKIEELLKNGKQVILPQ